MPSNLLIFCRPLLLLPSLTPSIRVFSNESVLLSRWPKYCSFSFSISPSNEYSGLISFRMDWWDLLAVQGTLNTTFSNTTVQKGQFFSAQLSLQDTKPLSDVWFANIFSYSMSQSFIFLTVCFDKHKVLRLIVYFFLLLLCDFWHHNFKKHCPIQGHKNWYLGFFPRLFLSKNSFQEYLGLWSILN